MDRFWARCCSNDLYNDVLSVGLIKNNKAILNFAIVSAQNSEIIENFLAHYFFVMDG